MIILNVSLSLGLQNSDTKIAAPSPNGTAMSIAKAVTLNVPRMRANVPYRLLLNEVGYHSGLVRNCPRSNPPKRNPAPSRNTKKKMPNTKSIELMPHKRIKSSITVSESGTFAPLFFGRRFTNYSSPFRGTKPSRSTIFCPSGDKIQSR